MVWWLDGGMKSGDDGSFGMGVLARVLGVEARWRMLEVASAGGWFAVTELSKTAGVTVSAGSKHVGVLVEAGILVRGKGRLVTLAPGVLAEDGRREVRLGRCRLDFGG